jgi:hypothetical protein
MPITTGRTMNKFDLEQEWRASHQALGNIDDVQELFFRQQIANQPAFENRQLVVNPHRTDLGQQKKLLLILDFIDNSVVTLPTDLIKNIKVRNLELNLFIINSTKQGNFWIHLKNVFAELEEQTSFSILNQVDIETLGSEAQEYYFLESGFDRPRDHWLSHHLMSKGAVPWNYSKKVDEKRYWPLSPYHGYELL